MRERLKALPGAIAVTAANPLPLDGRIANGRWGTEDALVDPSKFGQASVHVVLPGYFSAMQSRVIDGREYTEADTRPDSRYLIIDRVLAQKAFPGQRAVGRTIVARINSPEPQRCEVTGVVDHQRHATLARDGREAMFVADGYFGHGAANRWAVRVSGDPLSIASQARSIVTELNPRTGAIEVQPMAAYVAVGLVAATLMTGALRTMLVGVGPTDPATFVVMAAAFLLIAARRAGCPRCPRPGSIQWLRFEKIRGPLERGLHEGGTCASYPRSAVCWR